MAKGCRLSSARIAKATAFKAVKLPVGSAEAKPVAIADDDPGGRVEDFDNIGVEGR